jgi:hypothetical protein
MRPGAVGLALDEGRAAAAPGALDGLARGLGDGQDVVAVDLDAGQAIRRRAAGDGRVAAGVGERDLGGELVVLADEQDGQLPDRGHVQPLVEGPVVDRAVAEEGDRHPVRAQEPGAVAGAGRLEDGGSDDPARAHQADLGREQVHAPPASSGAALAAAEQLGGQLSRRYALGQGVAVPAVRAEDRVPGVEVRADARGDRLLADVGVAGPVDQALLMGTRQVLLAPADRLHRPVERPQFVERPRRVLRHGRRQAITSPSWARVESSPHRAARIIPGR